MTTTESESPVTDGNEPDYSSFGPMADFIKNSVDAANAMIAERNSVAATLKAAQGDPQGLLAALRETSDDPNVVKLRDRLLKAQEAEEKAKLAVLKIESDMDELLKTEVDSIRSNAQEQQVELTAKVDDADSKIKAVRNVIKKLGGDSALNYLQELTGRTNRAPVDGKEASATARVRGFDVYVDLNDGQGSKLATQKDIKGNQTSNLAAGARIAGVDTVTMQTGFFDAQGTRDSKQYQSRVEFDIKDSNGNVRHITAIRHTAGTTDDAVTEAPVSEGAQVPNEAQVSE